MLKSINKKIAILIIIAVSTTLYLPTLLNGFVLDDKYQVLANPWITDFSHIPELLTSTVWAFKESFAQTDYYRPVMFLPYIVEHALFGFESWGWHLVNIILHSLNAVLVFLIAGTLMSMKRGALRGAQGIEIQGELGIGANTSGSIFPLASALLFALHPVNSEVVNWVAGGTELTYTLFFLLSFYLYTLVDKRSKNGEGELGFSFTSPFYILSLISFFVAAFSKEAAIVLPFFIILYDYLRYDGDRKLGRLNITAYPAYFVIALFYLLMRFKAIGEVVVHHLYSDDLAVLTANILPVIVEYLKLLFFPLKLSHYHFFLPAERLLEAKIIFALFVVVVTVLILYRLTRKITFAPFLIALIIVPMIPTLYLLFFHDRENPLAFYSERYLYLPSVGFVILVSIVLMRFVIGGGRKRARMVGVAFLLVLVLGGVRTILRSFEWKSDMTLWSATVQRFPENYLARYHFSDIYRENGDIEGAQAQLSEAVRIAPDFKGSHQKLGNLYYSIGKSDEALVEFKEVLRIDPKSSMASFSIGIIYMDRDRWNEAAGELERAQETVLVDIQRVKIKNALAVSYARTGNMKRTREILYEALELDPENDETLRNIEFLDSVPLN